MVEITVEFIALVIPPFMFVVWLIWFRYSLKRLKRRYNPENDKGRKAEERRKSDLAGGREQAVKDPESSTSRSPQYEEPRVLQATDVDNVRKDRRGPRGIFKRRVKR